MTKVVIVGAGPAGLVAGLELVRRQCDVLIVEKAPRIGGLHQSFHYGPFTFDVGAHCFDTTDPVATEYILDILGHDYRVFPHHAANYVCGKYLHDPLNNPDQLMRLPVPLLLKGILDFAFRPEWLLTDSLEQLGRAIYGESFYRLLVKNPVEKTLQRPCADLHPDQVHLLDVNMADRPFTWSELMAKVTGKLQRIVGEQVGRGQWRKNGGHGTLAPMPTPHPASPHGHARGRGHAAQIYPASGGFEVFVQKLAEEFQHRGGRLLTGAGITQMRRRQDRIVSVAIDGHTYKVDWLVWSGTLKALMPLCGLEYTEVPPSSMILYNLEVRGEPLTDYLWIHCWDPSVVMSRVSPPCLLRPENAPPGYHGLCVEVPCQIGDERWNAPERLIPRIQQDLITMGLVASKEDVLACHIERLPAAFPILSRDYKVRLAQARHALSRRARNVVLIGAAAGRVGKMQNDQITYARQAVQGLAPVKAVACRV